MRNFVAFACLGVAVEVAYTALAGLFEACVQVGVCDFTLRGTSYIWMFPIYGFAAVVFPQVYGTTASWNVLLRASAYASLILLVEYGTGFLLETAIGVCPWKYTSGLTVSGYVRLDYFPLWMLFGMLIEATHTYLARLTHKPHEADGR
jgi:uncharacterized membrane protein